MVGLSGAVGGKRVEYVSLISCYPVDRYSVGRFGELSESEGWPRKSAVGSFGMVGIVR